MAETKARRVFPYGLADRLAVASYEAYLSTASPQLLRAALTWRDEIRNRAGRGLIGIERTSLTKLVINGWAANIDDNAFVQQVSLLPAPTDMRVRLRRGRADVAAAFARDSLRPCGFEITCVFEELPDLLSVRLSLGELDVEAAPTDTVADRYPDLVAAPSPQSPPVLAYIDGIDLGSSARRRLAWRPDRAAVARPSIPRLELLACNGELESARHEFRRAGWYRVSAGEDFRIDRLRFVLGYEREGLRAERFTTVKWRQLPPSPEAQSCAISIPVNFGAKRGASGSSTPEVVVLNTPIPAVHELHRVAQIHGHLVVDDEDCLVIVDPAARPDLDFVAGQWDLVHGSPSRRTEAMVRTWSGPTQSFEAAATITGRVGFNYFHSMIEYLPRLITLEKHPEAARLPVLVNADLLPSAQDALGRLIDPARVVPVSRDDVVTVSRMVIPGFHTDHRDSTIEPWWKGARIHWPTLDEFRHRLASTVAIADGPPRVFLVRPIGSVNGRGLMNQEQLVEVSTQFGFVAIDPGELSLNDQINLVRTARILVGAGGASMANLIFAQEGLRVLGLVSHYLHDFAMFSTLAMNAGAEYFTLTGPSDRHLGRTEFHRDVFHGDFWISPREFKKALRFLCQ